MVSWGSDAHDIVTELKREFALPEVLFVLPTSDIGKRSQTREPLSHFVDVVAIFFEEFGASSTVEHPSVVDLVVPLDLEGRFLAWCKRFAKIDSHHRVDYGSSQLLVFVIRDRLDFAAAVEVLAKLHGLDFERRHSCSGCTRRPCGVSDTARREDVWVELNPNVSKGVR